MRPLRMLLVEDSEADAELLVAELRRHGFDVESVRVETAHAMRDALAAHPWDVVLSDFSLPQFSAPGALGILRETGLDLPFIIVSGTIGEDVAVHALKAGAHDFMTKGQLGRLVPAIDREMRDAAERRKLRATELALSETRERMRFALDAAGVGTWEWDVLPDALTWSDLLERLHGLPPATFGGTLGAFLDLVHEEDRRRVREQIARFEGDSGDVSFEYRVPWPDGTTHWIAMFGRMFYDNTDRPLRAAGIGIDMTGPKELQQRLLQSQRMEAVGQLAGGVAHDFNNLLTAMLGHADLLRALLPDSRAAEHLEQIRKSAMRATHLTRQLLAFSRRQVLQPRVLDLNALVRELSKMLRRLIGEDVELTLDLDGGIAPIRADPGQIEQVIVNLAVNARDAMPRGGRLTIVTRTASVSRDFFRQLGIHDAAGLPSFVDLTVRDTGTGMEPAVKKRIFEPFFTTKPRGRGTGLGLATVYGIVKQSGAFVTVDSERGAGTTFRILFPPVVGEAPAPVVEIQPAERGSAGHERILLVEDDDDVRSLVRMMLERDGYAVVDVADAESALDAAGPTAEAFDLLVTDIVLPGLNGPELFERLRARRPAMKALYLSGYSDELVARRVVRPLEVPYLQKPFSAAELTRTVRDVLDAAAGPDACAL